MRLRIYPVSLKQGLILSASGGLAQALTLPRSSWWPLAFFCLIPLYAAAKEQVPKRAFLFGWIYGLTLGLLSFSWLAEVMAGYGGLGSGGWVILFLLAAFLALFQAVWARLICSFQPGKFGPYSIPIIGAGLWVGLDFGKNWVFTGFNWSPLAVGLSSVPSLMGAADLIGLYGLGLPVAAVSGWLFYLDLKNIKTYPLLLISILTVGALYAYGHKTYTQWEERISQGPEKKIAVLQASIDQMIKWDRDHRDLILARLETLMNRAQRENPWLTVWSETAAPFSYGYDAYETEWLDTVIKKSRTGALVGVTAVEDVNGQHHLFNRAWLMTSGGSGPFYDKRHLVPFGEYVPMAEELPFLKWPFFQGVLGAAGTYSQGPSRPPIIYDNVRLGIMICFESIFPYLARDRTLEGAQLLVVTTNDAWFGLSWAPEQHLHQSLWRAAENRRPLVRAANNGVSGYINPSGRLMAHSAQNEIETYIYPISLLPPQYLELTVFTRFGHYLPAGLAIVTALLALVRLLKWYIKIVPKNCE
ncbi:MAG: apolipoprotein N-acyltransferase [Deltaproteobacteria bacterium]|jgi:apolipoprotein N-acyltransferase|nr:apolipoprotein N-acyltransferase [Deltaproteobacteria bacterium]